MRAQSHFHLGPYVLFRLASQQGLIILHGPTPEAAYSSKDLHFFHSPHSVFDLIKAAGRRFCLSFSWSCNGWLHKRGIPRNARISWTRKMLTSQWIWVCPAFGMNPNMLTNVLKWKKHVSTRRCSRIPAAYWRVGFPVRWWWWQFPVKKRIVRSMPNKSSTKLINSCPYIPCHRSTPFLNRG